MNEVATMQDDDQVDGDFSSDDYAQFISFLDSGDQAHQQGYPVKVESRFPQGAGQPFFSIATQQNFGGQQQQTFLQQPPQQQPQQQPFFGFQNQSAPTSAPSSFPFGTMTNGAGFQQTNPSTPPSTAFFGQPQPSPQQQQQVLFQQQQQQQLLLRQQELHRQQQLQQIQQQQHLQPPPSPVASSSPPPASPNDFSMPQQQLPQITATNLEQCQQLLNEIYQWEQRQKEQLEQIRQFQKQFMMRPQKEGYDMLQNQHQQLKAQILQELRTLTALFQQVILPPADIQKVIALLQDLKVQQVQLELFQHELTRLALNPQQAQLQQPLCALVIAEQPLPMVVTKGKQLEDDPIVVQLLTGASVEVQSFSKVKVAMICDNQQVKTSSSKAIENDTQTMDSFRRQAKFYLKFAVGTRKNPVRLKFGIQLQIQQGGQTQTVTVESNASRSFIVITNECQWEEAEGILLKKDAFGEQMDVTWPQFANVLQRHFLRASRQDLVKPARYLTVFDFEYLRDKFFPGQTTINQKGYDNFWTWFGKGVQKLRYQRHICPLWQTGLIYGFLTREAVDETLMNEEVGTFLIRFAERHPGLFAVGYKTDDPDPSKAVRHYLIRPEDIGAKKTLPDFLSECAAFLYLLQVTPEIDNGKPKLRKFSRDVALQPYYSKKSSITDSEGYDDSLPPQQMARYPF